MQLKEPIVSAYRGEPIDIRAILDQISGVAATSGWRPDPLNVGQASSPQRLNAHAYRRPSRFPSHRLYLSTGIHGDEPAGPVAILELMKSNRWPERLEAWTCPCLNLAGCLLSRRQNFQGIDLNRDYRALQSDEVRAHVNWLKHKPNFDIAVCLHEDHSAGGFYLVESNPDELPSAARKIISRVAEACPIDRSPIIHDWPAENGVVHFGGDPYQKTEWTEAIFLATSKTRLCYTLKSPSQMPLAVRVTALVKAVQALADWVITQAV